MDPSTVLLGLVGGLGVYYVYTMATEKNRSTQQHRVVNMGNVQPPPLIRNPIGGNIPTRDTSAISCMEEAIPTLTKITFSSKKKKTHKAKK